MLGDFMPPNWWYGLCMVVVALFLFFTPNWWNFYKRANIWGRKQTREAENSLERNQLPEKIYTARTAGEIFDAIRNLTDTNVTKFAEPHIGKWLRVQNVIRNMSENENFINVILGIRFEPMPCLRFSKEKWGEMLETMDKGDHLAAEGRIVKLTQMALYLDDCEILKSS